MVKLENEENESIETLTPHDLKLSLGYSSTPYTNWTRLNRDDSGAGANAGSTSAEADRTFVADDPLSELVWSPHSGLTLKCADSSFTIKRTSSMLRPITTTIRPSNVSLTLPEFVTPKKPLEDEIAVTTSQTAVCLSSEQNNEGDDVCVEGCKFSSFAGQGDEGLVEIPSCEKKEPNPDVDSENLTLGLGLDSFPAYEVLPLNECKPSGSFLPNDHNVSGSRPFDKLESTAENNLQTVNDTTNPNGEKNVNGKIVLSEKSKKTHLREEDIMAENSPSNSGVLVKRRKGKEKVFSEGDVEERASKEKDESHESVESSNSAGIFSSPGFEQQLIVSTERVKREVNEIPASAFNRGHDSSFMSWMSSMMKGSSKSVQDEPPFLALTHTSTANEPERQPSIQLTKCKKSTGFESLFQSLYGLSTKGDGAGTLDASCHRKRGKETEPDEEIYDVGATPIAYSKQLLENRPGPSKSHPKNHEDHRIELPEIGQNKDETSSSSSLGKRKANSSKNVVTNACDPLRSLWITRFSKQDPGPLSSQLDPGPLSRQLDPCIQTVKETSPQCSADCTRLIPGSQNHITSSNDLILASQNHVSCSNDLNDHFPEKSKIVASKELQSYAAHSEASAGFSRFQVVHNDQKSKHNSNHIMNFARRLDAFKHFVSSNITELEPAKSMSCLFCGIIGHELRDCSEISGSEAEELSRNISMYNRGEEFPCLCIRCFQPNHWANSCPNTGLKDQNQSEYSGSVVNANILVSPTIDKLETGLNLKVGSSTTNSVQKCIASSTCTEKNVKENEAGLFGISYADKQMLNVPEGVFHAVKRLRLSRSDVLKLMNAHMPISQLDGFFLRVRLGKGEEGLGSTGYYVACITGEQNMKNSISVNVGGIKCLVQSQYVSNHDFLKDELTAWWSSVSRDAGKVPVEADLIAKVKKKNSLGL